jgi:PBP1b-binding outer membrane lipoprotein LpoB
MINGINGKKLVNSIIALSLIFLVSCSEPTIDASSNKAIQLSIEKVRESLPIDNVALFNSSLRILTIKYSKLHKTPNSNNKLLEIIDGKTGLEVIAEADKLRNSMTK